MKKGLMFTALACALTMGLASCGNENDTPAIVITVQSLRISGDFKTVYKEGEAFDSTGMVVTATFSNGQTAEIPAGGYTLDVPDMSTAGTKTVTVTCQGVTAKVTITVEPETYTVTIKNKAKFDEPWKVGDSDSLSLEVTAVKVADAIKSGELVISSSDSNVARVPEKSSVIEAVGEGTATITATFRGQYSDSVEITVEKALYRMISNPVAGTNYLLAHRNEKNPNALVSVIQGIKSYYWLDSVEGIEGAAAATVRVVDAESEYKYAIDLTAGEGESAVTKTLGVAKTGYSRYPYALGFAGEEGQLNPKHESESGKTTKFMPEAVAFKIDEEFNLICNYDGKELVVGSQSGFDSTGVGEAKDIGNPTHLFVESEEEVPATAITVDPESVKVQPGGVAQVKVRLTPVDSTDVVKFTSANDKIATVDAVGRVSGVAAGTTIVTVTAGSISKEVPVTVEGEALDYGTRDNPLTVAQARALLNTFGKDNPTEEPVYVTGEVLSASYYESGDKYNQTLTLKDAEGKNGFTIYRAIHEDIEQKEALKNIAEGDIVSAYGIGVLYSGTTYELTTSSGEYYAPKIYNIEKAQLQSVKLNKSELTLASGESFNLKVVPTPPGAQLPAVSWSTSDATIANVDQEGKVTAVKEGTATITANVTGFDPLTCAITVDDSGGGGESHDGSESSPFTPDEAIAKAEETGTTATSEEYYVRGTVKAITYAWKNNSMSCSVEGSNGNVFLFYKLACTEDESKTIVEGQSIVTAKGKIVNYNNNTPEFSNGCTLIKVENPEIELESVALSESEVELALNQEKTLSVVPTPAGAKLPNGITWESSDAETVSVANGLIKGLKAGSATITVHVPGFDDLTCAVTVKDEEINYGTQENPLTPEQAVAILENQAVSELTPQKMFIKGIVSSNEAVSSGRRVIWLQSTDGSVANYFECYSCKNTALPDLPTAANSLVGYEITVTGWGMKFQQGENIIYEFSNKDASGAYDNAEIVVAKAPALESVALNETEKEIKVDGKFQLEVVPTPAGGALPEGITWSSSDDEVASVSESGLVTGVKVGTATITVSVPGFDDLTCAVTVVEKGDEPVYVDATMTKGTNGYDDVTVNGKSAIKVGTSSKGGDMSVTVGAGATELVIYAAAWKGVTGLSLNISGVKASVESIALTADDAVSGSVKDYPISNEEAYKFVITLSDVTSETVITFTSSIAKRFVVWGAQYK